MARTKPKHSDHLNERYVVSAVHGYHMDWPSTRGSIPVEYCVLDRVFNFQIVRCWSGGHGRPRAEKLANRLNREEAEWEQETTPES